MPTGFFYEAGSEIVDNDEIAYRLSRTQAADSVNYLCDNENDRKVLKKLLVFRMLTMRMLSCLPR